MEVYNKYGGSTGWLLALLLLVAMRRCDGACHAEHDQELCIVTVTCVEDISRVDDDGNCYQIDDYGNEKDYFYTYHITLEEFSSPRNVYRNNWIDQFRDQFENRVIKSVVLRNNSIFISPLQNLALVKIEIIDLSHNFIKEFSIDSLRETTQLFSLDLSYNYMSEVNGRGISSDQQYNYRSSGQRPSESLKIINLSHNIIKNLEDGIFSTFSSLKTLDLSHNLLGSINFSTFQGLDELQTLNISFNYLKELNMALFQSHRLEYLDISYNRLITLYKQDLMNVASLKELNLQNNTLDSLHPEMFVAHTLLEHLNLSQNSFGDSLGESVFKNSANLRSIDLSFIGMSKLIGNAFSSQNLEVFQVTGNRLSGALVTEYFNGLSRVTSLDLSRQYFTSVGNATFTGADSLQVLDLSHNYIYVIETKAFVSLVNLTSIDLSFNRLTVIDFDHGDLGLLQILRVNDNLIKNINNKTFENLNALEELDISENGIEHLPTNSLSLTSLRRFYFRNNTISKIDSYAFGKLTHIGELDMSYFRLSKILNDTFMGLDNVRNLNISNNRIRVIEQSAFRGLVNLIVLDVSNNFLDVLTLNASHLPKLKTLKLHNNRLWNIGSLHGLSYLEFLDLSNNKLSFHADSFDSLVSIKEVILFNNSLNAEFFVPNSSDLTLLDLTMNNIKTLKYASNGTTYLRKILLGSNKVRNITTLNLIKNSFIQEIYLGRNDIADIETASFAGLEYLTIVDLSFNFVSVLNPGMFVDLQMLEVLNISHNRINEIKFGAFNGLRDLQILDLSFNEIVQIHKHIFFPLHLISSIVLDYNKMRTIDDLDSFSGSMTTISIGSNPLDCSWLGALIHSSRDATFQVKTLNKNLTGENLDGITCVRRVEIGSNSSKYLDISTNHSVMQYDIAPHLTNLTLLLENLFKNNATLAPRNSDVSLAPFLSNMTNLLQKILNKNYSLTVEKSNDKNLLKYYEQVEAQNANIRDILDQLRERNNVTDENARAFSRNNSTVPTETTFVANRELSDKIDKLYSIIDEMNKNSVHNVKDEMLNEFFRNISSYLDPNKLRSGEPGSSGEPISQAASDKLSAGANPDNYASHIKLTEACVVIMLIVMLAVIAYKAYLSRALSASTRLQSLSTQNIQMD